MSEEVKPSTMTPVAFNNKGVQLSSLEEAYRFAKYAASSQGLVPSSFKSPESIFVAMQMGAELGLPPMVSLNSIAVINGKPTIYGDVPLALVEQSGLMEDMFEEEVGADGKDDYGFKVTIQRKGRSKPSVSVFTVAKAKRAGLWGKSGPWTLYPDRMLRARARAYALRDNFPDVLKGFYCEAEARDIRVVSAEVKSAPSMDTEIPTRKPDAPASNEVEAEVVEEPTAEQPADDHTPTMEEIFGKGTK